MDRTDEDRLGDHGKVVTFRERKSRQNTSETVDRDHVVEDALFLLDAQLSLLSVDCRPKKRLALAARLIDEAARDLAQQKPAADVVHLMLIATCIETEKSRLNQEA